MKKAICCITAVLLAMAALGGCAIQGNAPTPTASTVSITSNPSASAPVTIPSPTASIPSTATPVTTSSPTTEPTATIPPAPQNLKTSTHVPDVVFDTAERNVRSSYVYEDELYIYLIVYYYANDTSWLLAYNKNTGAVAKVEKDCTAFAYQDYTIYWIKEEDKGCSLIRFDEKTIKSTQLSRFETAASYLCICENNLYFLMDEKTATASAIPQQDLYKIHTDGTGLEKIKDNVAGICFYKGKMYYSPPFDETGAAIYEYDMSTKTERKVTKTDNSQGFSAIFDHDMIGHHTIDSGNEILDLKTGEAVYRYWGTFQRVYGQYIVYMYVTQRTDWLMAYDTTSGKTYTLTELPDFIRAKDKLFQFMDGTDQNLYFVSLLQNGLEIYKLIIKDGKGKLVMITK